MFSLVLYSGLVCSPVVRQGREKNMGIGVNQVCSTVIVTMLIPIDEYSL